MTGVAQQVWQRLAAERVTGETLWARLALPEITDRVVAALDADGRRHLLVQLHPDDAEMHDRQSRGLEVLTRELAMPGRPAGRYLDVVCQDSTGHSAFDLIGGEIAERLSTHGETPSECVTRVIAKWRRFWGEVPRHVLSVEEQIGLFAELHFLLTWLVPSVGISEGVGRWRGPFSSRHDFEWSGRSVEVKATTSTEDRVHCINGIDQLAPPESGDLFFFSLQLRQEAGADKTLASLINECQAAAASDPTALSQLEAGLTQIGYSPVDDEEYSQMHLRIVSEALFRVGDGFPRLIRSSLTSGIPAGVEWVKYQINLSGFEHFCVARGPREFLDL